MKALDDLRDERRAAFAGKPLEFWRRAMRSLMLRTSSDHRGPRTDQG
jgi:hypothetical protein